MKNIQTTYEPYVENGVLFFPTRLSYQDTDMGGVVYYARYLDYAERARAAMLRMAGLSLTPNENIFFVVNTCNIKYIKPVKVNDILILKTKIIEQKSIRFKLSQDFFVNDELTTKTEVEIVVVNQQFTLA